MNALKKTVFILLGAAIAIGIGLGCSIVAVPKQPSITVFQWSLIGGLLLVLTLFACLPSLFRSHAGVPTKELSDLRFAGAVAVVLCPLTFFAVFTFGAMGTVFSFLGVIPFMFRTSARIDPGIPKSS